MGLTTGFMDYKRNAQFYKPVNERLTHYNEFHVIQDETELQRQGARCMDCGIPFCHASGCPVYNLIPEWNDLVYKGRWQEAYKRLEITNNFPEITGRICPAPCETSCTLSINSSPVTIKQLELAIIEKAFESGWVVPRPPKHETGKRIAIIGSGPSGLAAAQQLRRAGHTVIVYEKDNKPGGLLRYGIPDFKLDKRTIDRRIAQMEAEGIRFETGVVIGDDLSARYIRKSFDVILLTMGAGEPRDLVVQGRGLEGVHYAMEYLRQSNKNVSGEKYSEKPINAKNKVVLVIGGGDTGSDCIGTANRQGAKKVYQFEILPKPREWDKSWNPQWPEWPNILRTSTSQEEGCERDWAVNATKLEGSGINVSKALFNRVEWTRDAEGRFKMKEIPGSEFELKVDLVLLAMGFVHVEHSRLLEQLEIKYNDRSNIMTNQQYATSVPGIYSAGDAATGASLVVRAIFHGRSAAAEIDKYLSAS
ncbi:MAG: glutamate synthase subunit beta [Spirochaetales bacterium]|nr:glutamate synthase subunit beta [Spirochaetales bacterium]